MKTVNDMISDVLRREGGYVDHPADRGGATKYGVTQGTLSRYLGKIATKTDVRNLTRDEAAEIYREGYYAGPNIDALPRELQPFLFDCAVNHGPKRAIRFLQAVLNAAGFGPLSVDGVAGPQTRRAAAKALKEMGPWLLAALVEERRVFYRLIVERDPTQVVFLRGWLARADEFDTNVSRAA